MESDYRDEVRSSDTNVRLRWEIVSDLFFDFTIWSTYDNKNEGGCSIDCGLTTGRGWEY